MILRSKKRLLSSKHGVDRLSGMPDEVIVHILSFLPTIYAVRTVLLRRFRNLWTLVPNLTFILREFRSAFSNEWYQRNFDEAFIPFSRFVSNVLMFHRRPTIYKFHLDFHLLDGLDNKIIEEIKSWLRFAISRQVRDLGFSVESSTSLGEYFVLPAFTSQSLVKLVLERCTIVPQHPIQLGSLKELELKNVDVCNEAFQMLISGCPSLQKLRIIYPRSLENLRFTAPNIVKLVLYFCEVGEDIHVLVLDCPNLKILELESGFDLDVVDVSSVGEISINCTSDQFDGDRFIMLLQKLEGAETLNFSRYAFPMRQVSTSRPRLLTEDIPISCSMPKLKTFTILGYVGSLEDQLELIEFLLKNAVALDTLQIVPGDWKLKAVEEMDFVKRVSSFPRTSRSFP